MSNDSAKAEYAELMQMIRFYGNMRFALLTIFIAFTGGLAALLFKSQPPLAPGLIQPFKVAGLTIAFVCWVGEESVIYLWRHFVKRAVELESTLGYQVFSTLSGAPKFRFLPTSFAIRLLYLLVVLFWLVYA